MTAPKDQSFQARLQRLNERLQGRRDPTPDSPLSHDSAKWLGIHFRCCNVYARIYRSPDGRRYEGQCPGCGAPVHARVGQGGTSRRFFETT
jgi:hypothetical protein